MLKIISNSLRFGSHAGKARERRAVDVVRLLAIYGGGGLCGCVAKCAVDGDSPDVIL